MPCIVKLILDDTEVIAELLAGDGEGAALAFGHALTVFVKPLPEDDDYKARRLVGSEEFSNG